MPIQAEPASPALNRRHVGVSGSKRTRRESDGHGQGRGPSGVEAGMCGVRRMPLGEGVQAPGCLRSEDA